MKAISSGLLGVFLVFLLPAANATDVGVRAGCPQAVFDDGTMFNADLNHVNNSCVEDGKICPAQYFFDSNDNFDAICLDGLWQRNDLAKIHGIKNVIEIPAKLVVAQTHQEEGCPQGIFEDGMMWSADLVYVENTCADIGNICLNQYFYAIRSMADAVCTDSGWAIKKYRR